MDNQPASSLPSVQVAIFDVLDDAVTLFGTDQRLLYLNPSAQGLFQRSSDEVIGCTLTELTTPFGVSDLSLTTPPMTPVTFTIDDKKRYYQLEYKQLETDMPFIVWKDITDLRRLQMDYKDFIHTMAHDVKAPLGVAMGYSNILQSDLEEGSEVRFFADEIFKISMQIMAISNELTVLAELGQSEPIDISSTNIKTSIAYATRQFDFDLQARGIEIDQPESIPLVNANAPWLNEVIVNIFYQIIDQSGSPTRITIEANEYDGKVNVSISHNGDGLSDDERISLFEIHRPLDKVRTTGHGLGLDIARQLIERLHGTIGTVDAHTFYFELPAIS